MQNSHSLLLSCFCYLTISSDTGQHSQFLRCFCNTLLDILLHIFNFLRSLVAGHLVCHHRFQTIVREKTEEKKFFFAPFPLWQQKKVFRDSLNPQEDS